MSDAQTWTVIGGVLGLMGFGFTWLKTSLHDGLVGLEERLKAQIQALEVTMEARARSQETRLEYLMMQMAQLERDFREAFGFRLRTEVAPESSASEGKTTQA